MFGGMFSRIAMRDVLFTYNKLGMFDIENKSYSKRLSILIMSNLTKVYIYCRSVQCRLGSRLHNANSLKRLHAPIEKGPRVKLYVVQILWKIETNLQTWGKETKIACSSI